MNKVVFIVLSVYNGEKYFLEQLMSIYYQNYNNWYLIIIDDGSTDGSYSIAEQFVNDYNLGEKVRIIKQKNQGTCKAVERGLIEVQKINKGNNFVAYCDADDIRTRDKLEVQVLYMNIHKNCDLSFHDLCIIDQNGKLKNHSHFHNSFPFYKGAPFINSFFDLAIGNHLTTTEMLFKSEYINDIIPIQNSGAKDDWTACIFAFNNRNIQYIDEKLGYYRQGHNSIRKELNKNGLIKIWERSLDMFELLKKKFGNDIRFDYFIEYRKDMIELIKKGYSEYQAFAILSIKYPKILFHYFYKIIRSICKYGF